MPQDGAAPQPDPNAPAPAPEQAQPAPALPKNLIKYPAIQGLLAGMPPALSDQIADLKKKPIGKDLETNKEMLQKAGLMFYRSISGDTGVIFNALHIHPQDLLAADKAGKLKQIAPDLDKIDHELGKAGKNHPILSMQAPPGGPAAPIPQAPPQSPQMVPPAPASAQRKLMAARVMSAAPGAPTSGPMPGQGRLLNSILRPVL